MKTFYLCVGICLLSQVMTWGQRTNKESIKPTLKQADSLFLNKQWKEAIPIYESVLKAKPENALAWNRLGFSYQNLAAYEKAVVSYKNSLQHKPAPALKVIVHARLARVYAVQGEKDKAFVSLDSALHSGYANLSELKTEKDFGALRQDPRFEVIVKRATAAAFPCTANEQARQFDFWVGEWDAFVTGTKNLAGHSRIEVASGGCMVLENWTSAGSSSFEGKSMNFVDPTSGKWKQVWIGSNGLNVSEFLNGEYKDGAMRFDFEETNPQGVHQRVHFFFFNQGPDQVRQFHETSTDAGKTWTTTYDFTYIRKK